VHVAYRGRPPILSDAPGHASVRGEEATDISAYRDIEDDNIVARVNRAIPSVVSTN
jgi:hypothetical protein